MDINSLRNWELVLSGRYPLYLNNYEFLTKTVLGKESSHGSSMRISIPWSTDLTFFF